MSTVAKASQLIPDNHLIIDQPLLRLPHELLRKVFKTSQKVIERDSQILITSIQEITNNSKNGASSDESLAQIDKMIDRVQTLKRKMESLHEEERSLHKQSRQRISHLQEMHDIPSLDDDRWDNWSKIRLDRLLVDFMLRSGYGESAKQLAEKTDIQPLVDIDVFAQCWEIEESLKKGSTAKCLAWCMENKIALKKQKSSLEFELRLQQYIEKLRERKKVEARDYAKKFLHPHYEPHNKQFLQAAALLAYSPDTTTQPYKDLFSQNRWTTLARLFLDTHHDLFCLPARPLLQIALSAGLSSLKTPGCHSTPAASSMHGSSLCPICSTELNDLAKNVPYAHHLKSSVENDPVLLPNDRVYGRKRLEELVMKLGIGKDRCVDPTTGEEWNIGLESLQKVYIT